MGTESGRGSLTGAAAAPACPSVKARASAASSLPPRLFPSPRSGPRLQPPGEPWRRRTQGHSVPLRPYRQSVTPLLWRKRRIALPRLREVAAVSRCHKGARAKLGRAHAHSSPPASRGTQDSYLAQA